jgi:thioredoxin reductase
MVDPMRVDCAILGGGPAGLNAALVLGRAKRSVLVFDDNQPRNAVTQESHGFLTRDGVKPDEFRAIAHRELSKYPSVELRQIRITDLRDLEGSFELVANNRETFRARTVILATGLKEILPAVDGIHDFYGKSLFCCPYCEGWERKDRPLVVISEGEHTFHMAKTVWNWSHDLLVCTNGHHSLTSEQQETLRTNGIQVVEDRIAALVGKHGQLERIVFATQGESDREGGFVVTQWFQASPVGTLLGCDMTEQDGIVTDQLGRTTVPGVYAAGEAAGGTPSQLIIAAGEGSKAGAGVNTDLTERAFL